MLTYTLKELEELIKILKESGGAEICPDCKECYTSTHISEYGSGCACDDDS